MLSSQEILLDQQMKVKDPFLKAYLILLPILLAKSNCMCTGRRITILVKVSIELMLASYLVLEEFSRQIRMSHAN